MIIIPPASGGGSSHRRGGVKKTGVPTAAEIQDRIEHQYMLIQALFNLLVEKGVVGEDELKQWIEYMDSLDGLADGKLREDKKPQTCPRCKRRSPASAGACVYCGAPLKGGPIDRRARKK
jgi:hypothetical protein